MATRRQVLTSMGGVAVLAACGEATSGEPGKQTTPDAPDGLIVAATRAGLVTVNGDRRIEHGPAAVLSGDGDRVYAATVDGSATTLVTTDLHTGADVGRVRLAGAWTPRVVGPTGGFAAFTPPDPAGSTAGTVPAGRTHTPVLIAAPTGELHRLDLPGNVAPDAVSVDGAALFVLEWLPAQSPERYRVRMVDLPDGAPKPLLTRDKVPVPAEEEMRGEGRQAVLSPNGQVLYTLYTHQPDHQHTRDIVAGRPGGAHAFVHVLHLLGRWAYCLDLPDPFGHGPAAGHAIALRPDGRQLLVADLTGGRLAVADTETLTVTQVLAVPTASGPAGLAATQVRTFLGADGNVAVVDHGSGSTTPWWKAPGEIRGLRVDGAGSRLAVADPGGVTWVRLDTGKPAGRVPVDGLTDLVHAA
ncbi:YncE family protein [Virgisporangium aurantiacum]|uniref:Uncharacterized protein n=1 Tax=Virgisporangium aurantiacum TaxID=175570 RepID=A0A8J3Z8R4_9ACTN|nr:hypothetical protein [Virgisporangium aurantiacum]GIJ58443.1 hypothetical protein Vau01_059590 [Virgisporangium aurantiacum]